MKEKGGKLCGVQARHCCEKKSEREGESEREKTFGTTVLIAWWWREKEREKSLLTIKK